MNTRTIHILLKLYANAAACIAVLLFTVLIGIGAGLAGYKIGLDDGYGWQHQEMPGYHLTPSGEATTMLASATGNYTIDGTTFQVQPDDSPELNGDVVGHAAYDGTIYIETGRSVPAVYRTCVHERLHQHAAVVPHRWIYDMDDRIVDDTCLKLVYRLGTDTW